MTLWHLVFGADVYFACKINAMIVSFPMGIFMSGLMGISVQVWELPELDAVVFKPLHCCLEDKLLLLEEVQHHLKSIGFFSDVQC